MDDLQAPCQQFVGFLFKRRCGRLTREGCPYCKGVNLDQREDMWSPQRDPYFSDRTLYPGYQDYDWWRSADHSLAADFSDADGETLMVEDDLDFERDFEAS